MTIYGIANIKRSLANLGCNPTLLREIVRQIWSTGPFPDQIEFFDRDAHIVQPPFNAPGRQGLIYTQTVSQGGRVRRSWLLASDAYLAALTRGWVMPDPAVLILRQDQLFNIGITAIPELPLPSQNWLADYGLKYRFVTGLWLTGTSSLDDDAIEWHDQGLQCALAFANPTQRVAAQLGLSGQVGEAAAGHVARW
jgi:hypothetical protein